MRAPFPPFLPFGRFFIDETPNGLVMRWRADVTGPADATKAIVLIYDIFGYFDQTVQGADVLAYGDDKHKYKVFIPDWFKGQPCPIAW